MNSLCFASYSAIAFGDQSGIQPSGRSTRFTSSCVAGCCTARHAKNSFARDWRFGAEAIAVCDATRRSAAKKSFIMVNDGCCIGWSIVGHLSLVIRNRNAESVLQSLHLQMTNDKAQRLTSPALPRETSARYQPEHHSSDQAPFSSPDASRHTCRAWLLLSHSFLRLGSS